MSWFQVLKEDDTPEPRREEIPNFRDKVMNTSRWQTSRRKEILDAVTTDEALERYREDPDIKELVEKKNQSFIQDIEFIRRLLTEDTITNRRGNTFKSLKDMLGSRATQMAKRLELLGKAKKTSSGNIRESTEKTFNTLIADKKWGELLQVLSMPMSKSRFKQMIIGDSPLRKKIYDETRDSEYANDYSILLNKDQESFVSIDYDRNISDDAAKKYVSHLLNRVRATPAQKTSFIDEKSTGKMSMTRLFYSGRGLNPALEFLLDNESFNTSAMVKGKRMRSSFIDEKLMSSLRGKKKGEVPIPDILRQAYEQRAGFTAGDADKLRALKEAKKKGESALKRKLEEYYSEEMEKFRQDFLDYQKEKSGQVESGQAYRELLEDIEEESLDFVNDALGTKMTASELSSKKKELAEKLRRVIEGKADEEDKATFSEVEVMDEEHPFLSEDFNRRKIMSKKLGIGATPADIVIALQLASNMVGGGFTVDEIEQYFEDLEEIENAEKTTDLTRFVKVEEGEDADIAKLKVRAERERRDKFLDEVRDDYGKTRKALMDRIKDTMKMVLKEGRKLGVGFDRAAKRDAEGNIGRIATRKDAEGRVVATRDSVVSTFEFLEPYFYLLGALQIET